MKSKKAFCQMEMNKGQKANSNYHIIKQPLKILYICILLKNINAVNRSSHNNC